MKLKFRAEPKDIVIFLVFSLFLLYLVCIIILNLSSFAQSSTLHGLNPLPAFEKRYLIATLILFFVLLVVIITSVTSHFYEREKGLGLSTGPKKEKNYSRWLTAKEMKKELKLVKPTDNSSQYAGIPLLNNGKEIWVDNGEYHNLIIGSTGSGKTEMLVQPMVKCLAKKGESMIITDPKGEIYERNAVELKQKGYNIVLLNFREPQKGNAWNPLSLPYSLYKEGNQDKANELLDDLAMNILYDEKSQNADPFWEKTSADYFAGLSLGLFEDANPDQINLNSINLMTTIGEEKFAGSTYIKEYFNTKDPASPAYVNASSTLMAPSDTKGSILSVFKQKVKLFTSRENLSEMLSTSDFDMKDIGRKKTAVFLVIQDEKKTYHSLVTIFIKQCYETLIDIAQEAGGKLPYRTNFILDEFANMPPLKDVTTMVTAARSRNIRFNFIIQNFAQLTQVYGKENGDTIKGNCGNIIYLISSEIAALEEISKMCGDVKSKEKEKTSSMPLVTVSDLQRLPQWTMIILRLRMMPFKTKMKPNWQMEKENMWGISYPKATYPTRSKHKINLFDLKGFVQKKKEEKINEMLKSNGDINSGGMPKGVNPFGNGMPFTPPMFGHNSKDNSFNVDDLVKRIDAKIAELEEEERKEKEQKDVSVKDIVNSNKSKKNDDVKKNDDIKKNDDVKKNDEVVDISFDSKFTNGITDDQFFDDFFGDD
ncbi:MAG: type IV secretory system conjugative DNA transfer family protein [Bacilli bacterium]|nr:type IV secretory system conjugative DNA transfer family protein [Bacilli bacterium]